MTAGIVINKRDLTLGGLFDEKFMNEHSNEHSADPVKDKGEGPQDNLRDLELTWTIGKKTRVRTPRPSLVELIREMFGHWRVRRHNRSFQGTKEILEDNSGILD